MKGMNIGASWSVIKGVTNEPYHGKYIKQATLLILSHHRILPRFCDLHGADLNIQENKR